MSESPPSLIGESYLLVLNIALVEEGGRYWAEPLWHKDLLLHLAVIERLSLACPVEHRSPPPGWKAIDDPRITIVPLPPLTRSSILKAPLLALILDRAVRKAAIVHTGVAGWPFPLGWLASWRAPRRGRFLMIGVESSFWRVPPGIRASPLKRLQAAVFERINRACLDAADLTFFTQDEYRSSLLRTPRGVSHITPASWVDADQLIAPELLGETWARKEGRLLFAGRLTEAKGVGILLAALTGSQSCVDIIGEGELEPAVRKAMAAHPDRIRLLEPVAYGSDFFALLDRYDAIVVPTLSGEQPRILFDAFSRGVPAIVSDTAGNRQLVTEGVDGWIVPPGDAAALAGALNRAGREREALRSMGARARATMDARTHIAMHQHRATLIAEALAGGPGRESE